MKIGIGQFSYHRYFGDCSHGESDPGCRWSLADFLEKARSLGVGSVGVQTCYLNPQEIENFREISGRYPLQVILEWGHPDGLQMGKSRAAITDLRRWIARAADWSIPWLRIVAGYPNFRGQEPVQAQIARLAPILRALSSEAADREVGLAIENHADFTPCELRKLIEETGSPNLGAVLDFGNAVRLGEDLMSSVKTLAPFTVVVHLRDLMVLPESKGDPLAPWPAAPLGQGSLNVADGLRVLYGAGFSGTVLIELSHLHPHWRDQEDAVISQSLSWLQRPPG